MQPRAKSGMRRYAVGVVFNVTAQIWPAWLSAPSLMLETLQRAAFAIYGQHRTPRGGWAHVLLQARATP